MRLKPVLILKVGQTVASMPAEKGDFEHWIISAMKAPSFSFEVVNVFLDEKLPVLEFISAIVVTGSASMVTEASSWSESTKEYLQQAVLLDIPILGICYGHQLMADTLGGVVDFHPKGREIGTTKVQLMPNAHLDPLLYGLPLEFYVHVSHSQSVSQLPKNTQVLANNGFEEYHCLRYAEKVWGVQFHPEFDAEIMGTYIKHRLKELQNEGLDTEGLLANLRETPYAEKVLSNFSEIILQNVN